LDCTDDLTPGPKDPATLLLGRLSGKVFYDSYNQKYEIGTLAKPEDTEVAMRVGGKDYTIQYDNSTPGTSTYKYSIIDTNKKTLYTTDKMENDYEWEWMDESSEPNVLEWSAEKNLLLDNFNYNPYTYNYITGAEAIAEVADSNLDAFVNHVSMVENAQKNYTNKQKALKDEYATKIKTMTEVQKVSSSQKELSDNGTNPKSEPDYTAMAVINGEGTATKWTEDYIFNTEKLLLPVGYLEIPAEDKVKEIGYYPNYKYPSDHISIMTQYRFNKSE
jgi:hypothetical protein